MVHAGRLVHHVVQLLVHGSVVQYVYAVCILTVADQYSTRPGTKHDSRMLEYFTNNARSLYSVKIFYPDYIYNVHIGFFTYLRNKIGSIKEG